MKVETNHWQKQAFFLVLVSKQQSKKCTLHAIDLVKNKKRATKCKKEPLANINFHFQRFFISRQSMS
jgi:hypothetical protein